ncbi:hypothetical protein [uncultured Hyphomicrobium sp.]|uniref:hypothetical protein n=1 Tax=uncultured Hyphomicrobium sp. TaxID=194373 RepID=UPI0025F669CC|nr:hypothetical protein [uncultured Hyphomicrobium sp.]
MRALVVALALLAGLKIWIQDSAYRSATEDALLLAYRAKAADACAAISGAEARKSAADLSTGPEPRVTVGNTALSVHIWDFDNALWNARFRQPYLVLSAPGASLSCAYDILAGTATITHS